MRGFALTDYRGPYKRRTLTPHLNPGLEVVYVASGRPVWHTEGRAEVVYPGWVFYSLPWELHGSVEEFDEGWEIYFTNILLDRPRSRPAQAFGFHDVFAIPNPEARRISSVLTGTNRRAHPATEELARVIPLLVSTVKGEDFGAEVAATGLARSLIVELARSVMGRQPVAAREGNARRKVRAFFRDLPKRCGEPWTLASMASACGLGRTRFAEVARQETGDPPIMTLNRIRVTEARRRLLDTDDSMTAIAFDCGFNSSQYFARVFKAYTGRNARQYRKGQKGKR